MPKKQVTISLDQEVLKRIDKVMQGVKRAAKIRRLVNIALPQLEKSEKGLK